MLVYRNGDNGYVVMTGALGNDARSDQDIVIATLRLNYGRVRAIPNPCAIYTIFTPNANVPVIERPSDPSPPPTPPLGDDRGIHFLVLFMSSLKRFFCKPRLIIPRLNGPNETQQTTSMMWSTDHYNKTLRKILVYPKVTANMSFYSFEALLATAPVSDRYHVWDYPTGLFLCF